jgi:hypothetical protein
VKNIEKLVSSCANTSVIMPVIMNHASDDDSVTVAVRASARHFEVSDASGTVPKESRLYMNGHGNHGNETFSLSPTAVVHLLGHLQSHSASKIHDVQPCTDLSKAQQFLFCLVTMHVLVQVVLQNDNCMRTFQHCFG